MILEALHYLASWPLTGADHRRFVRSSVNLWSRANRCAKAWAPHEDNSKAAMCAAINGLAQRRTVVVLGSGLLRDVPIAALAAQFQTVVLVDLVHLAAVRLRLATGGLRNVRLVERDLSGYGDIAAGRAPAPLAFLETIADLDLVISANLLSQIGVGAKRRLAAERPGAMPDDTLPRLIAAHLDGLAALPCRACLVTDIAYTLVDRNGQVHEHGDLLHGVAAPAASASWTWPVVPEGEESKDYAILHTVIAT